MSKPNIESTKNSKQMRAVLRETLAEISRTYATRFQLVIMKSLHVTFLPYKRFYPTGQLALSLSFPAERARWRRVR